MRTTAPETLPIFRSKLQGELLATVLLDPEREQSLTELAKRLSASVATIQREADRLERFGVLRSRRLGKARLVRANTGSAFFEPLCQLVLRAFGPKQVVAHEFAGLSGVDRLFIFGSWAARYNDEPGASPADIDVLVVGIPDRDALYDAALRSERRLGFPVNVAVRSPARWESGDDGFLRSIRSSPLIPIDGAGTAA